MRTLIRPVVLVVLAIVTAAMSPIVPAAPAPRPEPPPIVTEWTLQMYGGHPGHAWNQETTYRSDGTCESPQYGTGRWHAEKDGCTIHFGERNNTALYVLVIDWAEMIGHVGGIRLQLRIGPKEIN